MKQLQTIPFVVLLLPLVAAIIVCNHIKPSLLWQQEPAWLDTQGVYTLHITSVPVVKNKNMRFEAESLSLTDTIGTKAIKGKLIVYIISDSLSQKLSKGDIINAYITPTNNSAGNPWEFNLTQYLRSQKVVGQAYCRQQNWQLIGHKDIKGIRASAEQCQQKLLSIFQSRIDEKQNLGVLSAITIGERNYLDNQTKQQFSAAGAMHVLAVSGLHVGIIYIIIYQLLTCFGIFPILYKQKRRNAVSGMIIILCLWFYAFLTCLSPSVVRASLMLTIFTIGKIIDAQPNTYNIIAASAFLTLAIEPQALYSISFQLSYGAVGAIVYFQPKFSALLRVKNRYVNYVWNLMTLSVAAQLGTLPISLWYFCQTSNYFWLTNLVVIPYATVLVYAALFYLLTTVTPLAALSAIALNKLLTWLNMFVAWVEHLPYSTSQFSLTPAMLAVLVSIVITLAIIMSAQKYRYAYVSLFTILLCSFVLLHYNRMKQIQSTQQLIVYNASPIIVALEHGRNLTLITDSSSYAMNITEQMCKRQFLKVDTIIDISQDSLFSFVYNTKNWLIIKEDILHNKYIKDDHAEIDYLLYSTTWSNKYSALFDYIKPTVLASRNMSKASRMKLQQATAEHNIDFVDVSKSAFIIDNSSKKQ